MKFKSKIKHKLLKIGSTLLLLFVIFYYGANAKASYGGNNISLNNVQYSMYQSLDEHYAVYFDEAKAFIRIDTQQLGGEYSVYDGFVVVKLEEKDMTFNCINTERIFSSQYNVYLHKVTL